MTDTTANRGYPFPEGTDFLGDTAAAVQALAEAVDGDVEALDSSDTAWTVPALTNAWVSFDGGATYATPRYRKDASGFVHLAGMVKSGTLSSAAFTLPAGYRPGKRELFLVISNDTAGQVQVHADGSVVPSLPASNAWVSLSGITFLAES